MWQWRTKANPLIQAKRKFTEKLLLNPVWLISETGSPFFNNIGGIFVDQTAGTRSSLDNIYMQGFYYAVEIDQQLDMPISNLFVAGCYCGITSYGANRIVNCVVDYFGVGDDSWPYWGTAFRFEPDSLDGGISFVNPNFQISNCIARDGDVGYWAGGAGESDAPHLDASDSVSADCYYGYACWDILSMSIVCPGLYNNNQDKNFAGLPFTSPVYETVNPFVTHVDDHRLFLDPGSSFVNNGASLPLFPGWTTYVDATPDEEFGDIWTHYHTTRVHTHPTANINWDDMVNLADLAAMADSWLTSDPVSSDLDNDGTVDFSDYAVFAQEWLHKDVELRLYDTATQAALDPQSVQGNIGLYAENLPQDAWLVSVYIDNLLMRELEYGWDAEYGVAAIDSSEFSNGWHVIKLVSTDFQGHVTNHKPVNVYFDNLIHGVSADDHFYPTEDYHYTGFYDRPNTLEAQLLNSDGQAIWTNTYTGSHVSIVIPGATFGTEQFCQLVITETGSGIMAMTEGTPPTSTTATVKDLTKKFKQADWPNGPRMLIIMPNKDVFKARRKAIVQCAQACEDRNVTWLALYHKDVTPENLTYLYTLPGVRYIYWCGHANTHVGRDERNGVEGVRRTHTICWKHTPRKIWRDKWEEIGAFAWIDPDREPLPGDWDNKGFNLWSLGMYSSWNKKIVFVDGCNSGVFADMAFAYGMFSLQGQGSLDQVYIGWKMPVETSSERMGEWLLGDTTAGIKLFWERMGRGDSIQAAFDYVDIYGSAQAQRSFFGGNTVFEMGLEDDNIALYGHGAPHIDALGLEP